MLSCLLLTYRYGSVSSSRAHPVFNSEAKCTDVTHYVVDEIAPIFERDFKHTEVIVSTTMARTQPQREYRALNDVHLAHRCLKTIRTNLKRAKPPGHSEDEVPLTTRKNEKLKGTSLESRGQKYHR